MAGRHVAVLSYLPIPGAALVAVLAAPRERLVRYHAWQGGSLVVALYVWVALWGFVGRAAGDGPLVKAAGMSAGVGLLVALVGIAVGSIGAARGRYPRLRPVWDVLRLAGR